MDNQYKTWMTESSVSSVNFILFIDISKIHPLLKKKTQKGIEVTDHSYSYSHKDFNPQTN